MPITARIAKIVNCLRTNFVRIIVHLPGRLRCAKWAGLPCAEWGGQRIDQYSVLHRSLRRPERRTEAETRLEAITREVDQRPQIGVIAAHSVVDGRLGEGEGTQVAQIVDQVRSCFDHLLQRQFQGAQIGFQIVAGPVDQIGPDVPEPADRIEGGGQVDALGAEFRQGRIKGLQRLTENVSLSRDLAGEDVEILHGRDHRITLAVECFGHGIHLTQQVARRIRPSAERRVQLRGDAVNLSEPAAVEDQ